MDENILKWLLQGDVSIQYQVHRDLLKNRREDLKQRMVTQGWGAKYLGLRHENGHWGSGFYQPKWTSSHYTLLDLRNLCMPKTKAIAESIHAILVNEKGPDGGVNPGKTILQSDVCVNGMVLNYASYFGAKQESLKSVVDYILQQQLPDGGFNCRYNRQGARHSSLHSTLSVIEGINEYARNGYSYRTGELLQKELEAREFILQHRLFKSDKTGKIIDKRMLMLSYPSRWRYDVLRALDYFRHTKVDFDDRMEDALDVLLKKQRSDGRWPLQQKHPGKSHFDMETVGQPSRWNTLRALRVLKHFNY